MTIIGHGPDTSTLPHCDATAQSTSGQSIEHSCRMVAWNLAARCLQTTSDILRRSQKEANVSMTIVQLWQRTTSPHCGAHSPSPTPGVDGMSAGGLPVSTLMRPRHGYSQSRFAKVLRSHPRARKNKAGPAYLAAASNCEAPRTF